MTNQDNNVIPFPLRRSFFDALRCPNCFTMNLLSHLNKKMATKALSNSVYRCALCGTSLQAEDAKAAQAA